MLKTYAVKNKKNNFTALSTLCNYHAKQLKKDGNLSVKPAKGIPDRQCYICCMLSNAPQPKMEDI